MKRILLLPALALFAGCASLGIQTDAQRIATACAGAASSIDVLTIANGMGKLTADQQGHVLLAISVISPVCGSDTPPTLDDVTRAAFDAAIKGLQAAATHATAEQVTP